MGTNAVGYMPDGTAMNAAGNELNHPENMGPDTHVPGSPLPPPLFGYTNDIGYMPDGTPMELAGNELNHFTGTHQDGERPRGLRPLGGCYRICELEQAGAGVILC